MTSSVAIFPVFFGIGPICNFEMFLTIRLHIFLIRIVTFTYQTIFIGESKAPEASSNVHTSEKPDQFELCKAARFIPNAAR